MTADTLHSARRFDGSIRVGIDVASVSEVAHAIEHFGDRYTTRLFTEHELACCENPPRRHAEGLAARFAAKEAVIKVLRMSDEETQWRSIEVRRHRGGWCDLVLSGIPAELAERAGISDMALSLTHEGDVAAAVVIALCSAEQEENDQQ